MTEKAAILKKRARRTTGKKSFPLKAAAFGLLALLMEPGGGTFSAAPCAAALAAGLDGSVFIGAMAGGVLGAILHGFPAAFSRLGALGIVLAARVLPDFGNKTLRKAERCVAAAAAVFFSRVSDTSNASELLSVIVAAAAAGIFAACVSSLYGNAENRVSLGDIGADPKSAAAMCVTCALVFMALGGLDYRYINLGRVILGFAALELTERKSIFGSAVVLSALCGVCLSASGAKTGAGAAVLAIAAFASGTFARRGKIVRALGFVFFSAAGMLTANVDEGGWRILVEAAVSGALFAALPLERLREGTSTFSDKSVAAVITERLNFAADAIAGIGSGISAAADVLDKKYALSPADIADRAADRACRSCPNSMVCWGREYERFRKEFNRLVEQLRTGFELTEFSMSPDCAELCVNRTAVIKAVGAEYSRYVSAMADERRVRELRRIYTDNLSGVRDILRDMGELNTESLSEDRDRSAEERAERVLKKNGVVKARAFVMRGKNGKTRFEAYGATEPRVTREYLGSLLSSAIGCELELPEIGGSGERFRISSIERTRLSAKIGAYQVARGENTVCGDCYECFTGADGALYVILSDGMGTGSRARVDSTMACSVMSKLLKSGIALSAALETVNTVLMVKSADESFATLDICKIDLNSGECAVYKAGAATTYIKSDDRLIRASLSSPPAGTGGKLTVPAQRFVVRKGDIILMMTDGAAPDEQWLTRELSRVSDPSELSERIAKAARGGKGGRDDDISVIAAIVG